MNQFMRVRSPRLPLIVASAALLATSASAVLAAEQAETLAEVIVTAQKREQNLQDVGTSIAVLTGEQIAQRGMTDLTSIVQQTPGVEMIQFSPVVTNLSIRGISQASYSDHLETPVAVYVDEAYIGSNGAIAGALFDIDRIEVLRGPQGTLFGRNATAGLVHYLTRKPTAQTEGYFSVTAAQYGELGAEGAIGGTLAGDLLGRVSFSYTKADGYIVDSTGPTTPQLKHYALRAQLSKTFGEDTKALLSLHYARNRHEPVDSYAAYAAVANADGLGTYVGPNDNPYGTCNGCDLLGYRYPDAASRRRSTDGLHDFNRTVPGATLKITSAMGGVNLTSITDYYIVNKTYVEDSDASPNPLAVFLSDQHLTQFSQELRLDGSRGNLQWIGGLYYMDLRSQNLAAFPIPLFGLDNQIRYGQSTRSEAVFAQLEYAFTPTISGIIGARSSMDQKKIDMVQRDNAAQQDILIYNPSTFPAAKRDFNGFSGKLELDYKPVKDVLFYGSINRGYKGGNWNAPIFPTDPATLPHDAEKLTSYEVGFKSTLADGKLRLNGDVFYYDYKDYQAYTIQSLTQSLFNKDATLKGAELEITALPVRGLTLQLGYAGLQSAINGIQFPSGATAPTRRMPMAPTTSANALVRYEWQALAGTLALQGDGKYDSVQYYTTFNGPVETAPSRFIGNVRASYTHEAPQLTWEITAFVRNVGDKLYTLYQTDVSSLGFAQATLAPPRVFGGTVTIRFH